MALVSGKEIRKRILRESKRAHVGHIGSALSVADIMAALFGRIIRCEAVDSPERDRFVMSKGHAALALYSALDCCGRLSADLLPTFCADGSSLGVHPEHFVQGIDFSTGSLGQGLSYAVGCALAARIQGSQRRAFVLLSDGECNEGSVWESVMFSAHHHLSNLVAVIDMNGQQAFGYTLDVLSLSPMADKWQGFGWDVHEVDGHNVDEIVATVSRCEAVTDQPHLIVARTTFGKGVSFMENKIKWHYWPMSDEEYDDAMAQVEAGL